MPDTLRAAEAEGRLFFFQGDVAQKSDVEDAVKGAVARFGLIDGAFLSAGIHHSGSVLDWSEQDWDKMVGINLKGMAYCLRAVVPVMQSSGGSLVLMGSDQVFIGKQNSFLYGMTKGAVGQITKSLALDLAARHIRVNAVCPGTIRTPMAEKAVAGWADKDFGGNAEAAWTKEAEFYPLHRVGQPSEVAQLVLFLLGEQSSFMTGANIPIDGGYTAQ